MIIDGWKISQEIQKRNKEKIKKRKLDLSLSVVLIGRDLVSLTYVNQKEKAAQETGIKFLLHQLPLKSTKNKIIETIKKKAKSSSGLIVQLPLIKDEQEILDSVPQEKDIDLLSQSSLGRFYSGDFSILPPVVGAVSHIFKKKNLQGKHVAVVGFGRLVGRPLSFWFSCQKATVTIINEFTPHKNSLIKQADIVVSGVGCPGVIKEVKKKAIIIDAGSCFVSGSVKGDASKKACSKASFYTPVPGGIGPITTACLIENLIKLNEH